MAKDHGPSIKNDKQYDGLREKGMSKSRAAAISNSPGASSRGGKSAGSKQSSRQQRSRQWRESGPEEGCRPEGRQEIKLVVLAGPLAFHPAGLSALQIDQPNVGS